MQTSFSAGMDAGDGGPDERVVEKGLAGPEMFFFCLFAGLGLGAWR